VFDVFNPNFAALLAADGVEREPQRCRGDARAATGDDRFVEVDAAGGLTSRQLLDLLHALRGLRLAGMDLDEVSPPLDMGHVTVLAALKCIFEFMGNVHLSRT